MFDFRVIVRTAMVREYTMDQQTFLVQRKLALMEFDFRVLELQWCVSTLWIRENVWSREEWREPPLL